MPSPSLLPILRSQQQAELLVFLLDQPDDEFGLSDLAKRLGIPHGTVLREVDRAERAGLVTTRRVGRTRLVRAETASPYFAGLRDVLVKAFGVPVVLARELDDVEGIDDAYVFGSWADRHHGDEGARPVGDIDVLVLGQPDRADIYAAASRAEERLGRRVDVALRPSSWLEDGTGTFHETVTTRALVPITLPEGTPPAARPEAGSGPAPPRSSR